MVNPDQIVAFLQTLEPDFQSHRFYWSGLHPSGQRTQAVGTLEEVLPDLVKRNQQGYGIYACINAIDNPDMSQGFPRRRKVDVTRVRAVYADWDTPNKPVPPLPIEPTMAVQTSEGKFHFYWAVDDMALEDFEPVQRGIVAALGSDGSVIDLSRVLRVPGFEHTKDLMKRHDVALVKADGPRYSATTIKEAFPPGAVRPKFATWDGTIERKASLTHAVIAACYLPRPDGGFNIRCPWAAEHTTPDGNSDSTYWPPAESNDGRGSYVCMHAHCRGIRMVDELDRHIAARVTQAMA